jgi:hypothetical protein
MRHTRTKKAGTLATGVHGRIDWHGRIPVADVHAFIVERDGLGNLSLRASIANANDYAIRQSSLTFIVTVTHGEWRWPIVEITKYADHALTARLGAPQSSRGVHV